MRLHHVVEPALQGRSSTRIAFPDGLDPAANLACDQDTQEDRVLVDMLEPAPNVDIGTCTLAQFRENVCIEQEASHNATRRPNRRGRPKSESRPTLGIPSSIAFNEGARGESNA